MLAIRDEDCVRNLFTVADIEKVLLLSKMEMLQVLMVCPKTLSSVPAIIVHHNLLFNMIYLYCA